MTKRYRQHVSYTYLGYAADQATDEARAGKIPMDPNQQQSLIRVQKEEHSGTSQGTLLHRLDG